MEFVPVFSALVGAVVGFGLGLVGRLLDHMSRMKSARSAAAEGVIAWAFRIAMAPDETWMKTLLDWTEDIGPVLARFSSARAKGNKYVVGWVSREINALIAERNNGQSAQILTSRAMAFRDELTQWVDRSAHAHRIAEKLGG